MTEFSDLLAKVGDGPVLVLSEASSPVEQQIVADAVAVASGTTVDVVDVASDDLATGLASGADAALVPVRVVWLPSERGGERRAGLADLLTLDNPRHPRRRRQSKIVETDPDRYRLVVGEPAGTKELHERWIADTGGEGGRDAFAAYVRRMASLALERAERAVIGDRYKVPRLVAEEVLNSARFRTQIAELAMKLERTEEEVAAEAEKGLRQVVASQSRLAIDIFSAISRPVYSKAWTIDVDETAFEGLRELNRRKGLIFLPAHRSYADTLILASVLHEHGFPRNHTPGGNNLSFWPLGPIARRTGVVFIPRSLKGDDVNKLVLREYLGYLAAKRFNLEWYMEGGRSRTGKLRPPRFGLLQFVVEALQSGRVDDVTLVPVSITYDQLPEVGLMAAEEQGAAKQSEGLGWLARYVRGNQRRQGNVHVRFGEPLSLREGLDAAAASGADHRLAMQKVAFEVFNRINAVTPITAMSLVTLALLGVGGRALTVDEVQRELEPFLDYIKARDLPIPDPEALRSAPGVQRTLDTLMAAKLVSRFDEGTQPVFAIEPGQHHSAAFYRNSAIHWFVNRAIFELATIEAGERRGDEAIAAGWEAALRLRDLLKFEFFFSNKRTFSDELAAEATLLGVDPTPGAAAVDPRSILANAGFLAAPIVLRSFLEAYFIVADRLAARSPRLPLIEREFVAECSAVGRQYIRQQRLRSPEGVSRELFASALQLAANRDLVDPGRHEVATARKAFAAEVAAALDALEAVEAIDRQRRQVPRHIEEVSDAIS